MKKLQVKAEVWFDVEIDDSLTEEIAISWLETCRTLGDMIDIGNPGLNYYEIANHSEDICDSNICSENSIWIQNDNGDSKIINT